MRITDGPIVQLARTAADDLLDADPGLTAPAHAAISNELTILFNKTVDLSRIS